MDEAITFSARASLVALGLRFQQWGIWEIVQMYVQIDQKVRVYTPLDKLLDCLIMILAGGHGVVEVNTKVRPDLAVQRAFGRTACAEQSTISDTLNACTAENAQQWRRAFTLIFRQHSRSYRHDYAQAWQVLDIDLTGLPAGRLGEGVTKGYFAKAKNCRGRQLGRVLATLYDEIVVDRLYDGKRKLDGSLPELLLSAEEVLDLPENRRENTILRVDGGAGNDSDIGLMLERHYQILIKVQNWRRATKLAGSVIHWFRDPKVPDREVGWVEQPHIYKRPTRQLALRKRTAKGTWSYHALVLTLTDAMLFWLCQQPMPAQPHPEEILLAALHAYDLRGGGVETQNRGDKQGLALTHRNKHRFAAQEMLVLLGQLAHDLVIWTRDDLSAADQRLQAYGVQRTVRDVLQIPGCVHLDAQGRVQHITLNELHPLANAVCAAFAADDLSLNLGKI